MVEFSEVLPASFSETRYHIVGVSGAGMTGIARILLQANATVSGSDLNDSDDIEELKSSGLTFYQGHSPETIAHADIVLRSSAIPEDNCEIIAARNLGLAVYTRRQFFPVLLQNRFVVAIAGTHGKSTTSAMIVTCLLAAGRSPGYLLGAPPSEGGVSSALGSDVEFVIEADEYAEAFLGIKYDIAVLTNIEYDHHDYFQSEEDYINAFRQFIGNRKSLTSPIFGCPDAVCTHNALADLGFKKVVQHYGFSLNCTHRLYDYASGKTGISFKLESGLAGGLYSMPLYGKHNAKNAVGASLAVCSLQQTTSVSLNPRTLLGKFNGIRRRSELIFENDHIKVIDDYAHHPSEIVATLSAIRERFPGLLVLAVWEPHQFTRLEHLKDHFAIALDSADALIVTSVFSTREAFQADFNYENLAKTIGHRRTLACGVDCGSTVSVISQESLDGWVIVLLAAGFGRKLAGKMKKLFG